MRWNHGLFCSLDLVVQKLTLFFVLHSCHLGKSIIYDTVSNSSWAVDVRTHGIVAVIERVLSDPWPPSVEIGREVPEAIYEEDCVVSSKCQNLAIFILIAFSFFFRNVIHGNGARILRRRRR